MTLSCSFKMHTSPAFSKGDSLSLAKQTNVNSLQWAQVWPPDFSRRTQIHTCTHSPLRRSQSRWHQPVPCFTSIGPSFLLHYRTQLWIRVGVFVCLFTSSLKWLSAVSAVFISEASGKTQGKRPGLSLSAGFENWYWT